MENGGIRVKQNLQNKNKTKQKKTKHTQVTKASSSSFSKMLIPLKLKKVFEITFFFLISTLVFICKVPDSTSLAGCVDFVLIFSFSNSTVTLFIQCFDQEVM